MGFYIECAYLAQYLYQCPCFSTRSLVMQSQSFIAYVLVARCMLCIVLSEFHYLSIFFLYSGVLAGSKTGRQAGKQASTQAGRQAARANENNRCSGESGNILEFMPILYVQRDVRRVARKLAGFIVFRFCFTSSIYIYIKILLKEKYINIISHHKIKFNHSGSQSLHKVCVCVFKNYNRMCAFRQMFSSHQFTCKKEKYSARCCTNT